MNENARQFCLKIVEVMKLPNCLCGFSTRQLELLLWRAGPTAQHTPGCPIFFIQLNYVHNNKRIRNKVLPPYAELTCHKVALGIQLPLNQRSHARQTLRRRCWAVKPALKSNSSNFLLLIPHRQLGNYLLSTGKGYGPTTQHMQA